MGDPRKSKNKYSKPKHPWQAARLEEESIFMKDYGLKNKKEIWKAASFIKRFKIKAKEIIALRSEQAKIEQTMILQRLHKLKLINLEATIEDVLDIPITAILDRRLQTQIFLKGFARSIIQARQFITHGHITVKGARVNKPSYIVSGEEESLIAFTRSSKLSDEEHPERKIKVKSNEVIEKPKETEIIEKNDLEV